MPTLGMKAFAAAVPLAFAVSAFFLGAMGIRRKTLYVVGAAATVTAVALLLVLDPARTDPVVAAFVAVPALLLAWLAPRPQ